MVTVERPDDAAPLKCTFEHLSASDVDARLRSLAHPETVAFDARRSARADAVTFQPCPSALSQDRYVMRQLEVHGQRWSFTAVFDGHLGDATVAHTAYHLPIIVTEHLEKHLSAADCSTGAAVLDPETVRGILSVAITSFDEAIAGDVLALFPGGLESLSSRTDEEIATVINDFEGSGVNYKKAKLCMYGTTALVALVDPSHENLWVASLGDCEAALATPRSGGGWRCELLNEIHNAQNTAEVDRVRREHPGEPESVLNERVLGTIAPFRCIGDTPFKMPAVFTRRILFNLYPGVPDPTPWELFLSRNHTPPYISAVPEVTHRRLPSSPSDPSSPRPFLLLATDGLRELYDGLEREEAAQQWVDAAGAAFGDDKSPSANPDNMALRVLRTALGGNDLEAVSQMITLEMESPWMDDTTVVVHVL
ncbi:protein serine/threonine phosphatase 2C [Peniophora sp. CONT]|nr:protein serine/threonine phosphatase 2C [Peniophora sp. CONT]